MFETSIYFVFSILLGTVLPQHSPFFSYVPINVYNGQAGGELNPIGPVHSYLQSPLLCHQRPGCVQNLSLGNNTVPRAVDLFTPAIQQYPAETKAQLDEYNKALAEEAMEAREEAEKTGRDSEPAKAVSYVNVKLGGDKNVNYHYSV